MGVPGVAGILFGGSGEGEVDRLGEADLLVDMLPCHGGDGGNCSSPGCSGGALRMEWIEREMESISMSSTRAAGSMAGGGEAGASGWLAVDGTFC